MNRKSETAVNKAIQYLSDLIIQTEEMNIVDMAVCQIDRLQMILSASEERKKTPEGA